MNAADTIKRKLAEIERCATERIPFYGRDVTALTKSLREAVAELQSAAEMGTVAVDVMIGLRLKRIAEILGAR